jgi:predicted small secreted protein
MKTNIHRLLLGIAAAMLLVSVTSGCKNTAHGAGQDIENMGDKIQEKTD